MLPLTSDNGITGTWAPATINTTIASNTIFTFTPDGTVCSNNFTIEIVVEDCGCATPATVSIDPINPICENETISLNAVLGGSASTVTWMTAGDGTYDNTMSSSPVYTPGVADIAVGTVTLTATTDDPDGIGICTAGTSTVTLVINSLGTPTFSLTDTYCEGQTTDPLPTTSTNGITGTWDAAQIDNMSSGNYTFTPDASQCANPFILNVTITPNATPTFILTDTYCEGETTDLLPLTSNNGITGTWNIGQIDNMNSGNYTFTHDGGQCANIYILNVTITPNINPTFPFPSSTSYCSGGTVASLPTTSDNLITGTWDIGQIDNTTSGIYTFTPDAGQCSNTFTLNVTISSNGTTTSVVSCDDGDPCTVNDEQTILDSDGTICIPCQGVVANISAPLVNSINICQNEPAPIINLTGTGDTYLWYNSDPSLGGVTPIFNGNDFQPNIDVSIPNVYNFWVTQIVNNCEGDDSSFTITIDASPLVEAGQDLTLDCITNEVTLEGNSSATNVTINWSGPDPDINSQILDPIVTIPGTYQLEIIDIGNNCSDTDEVIVFDVDEILAFNDDVILQDNNPLIIDVLSNDNLQGYSDTELTILNTPNGMVEVQNDGTLLYTPNADFEGIDEFTYSVCSVECPGVCAEAIVRITVISDKIRVPDAFSPNDDNVNDLWVIPGIEDYPNNQLTVINRWGNVIHDAKPYTNKWDGTNSKGGKLPEGTYYFILRLDVVEEAPISGTITIVR